jgi:hypothetical protein
MHGMQVELSLLFYNFLKLVTFQKVYLVTVAVTKKTYNHAIEVGSLGAKQL